MNLKSLSFKLLIVALVAVIATSAYTAKADDDSRRKIVGTWLCDVPNGQPVPFQALQTFHEDGTFIETSSLLGRGRKVPLMAHGNATASCIDLPSSCSPSIQPPVRIQE